MAVMSREEVDALIQEVLEVYRKKQKKTAPSICHPTTLAWNSQKNVLPPTRSHYLV